MFDDRTTTTRKERDELAAAISKKLGATGFKTTAQQNAEKIASMTPADFMAKKVAEPSGSNKGGVFVAIETKFGSNKPTEHQKAFLETVNANNSFGFVVNETTIDVFAQWLENFDTSVKLASHKKPIPDEVGAAVVEAIRILTEPLMEHKAHKIKNA